jgi:hypothetical protein
MWWAGIMSHPLRLILGIAALFPASAVMAAADGSITVDTIVDMTDAGRNVVPPTPGKPVYFYPRITGYCNTGPLLTDALPPPSTVSVERVLAKDLEAQGYRVMTPQSPPSIVLVFSWGTMSPSGPDDHNMLTLVAGASLTDRSEMDTRADHLMTLANTPRYFLTVTALDAKALKEKKNVPLWYAYVSTEIAGRHLADVLPALIATGVRKFGIEMSEPEFTEVPLVSNRQ